MEQKIERRAIKIDGITRIVMVKVLPYMDRRSRRTSLGPPARSTATCVVELLDTDTRDEQ
jgi:hypothetical protein